MSFTRHIYKSAFAPYIDGLIRQKKADGFIYDFEAYILYTFDSFCLNNRYIDPLITREITMKWAIQRECEGINYRNQRVSILRQLSLFMNSLGISSYIPHFTPSGTITVPHILSREELQALFMIIDVYLPDGPIWQRFSLKYQVLFRLYYCCGLRLAEGCNLQKRDVDIENGILTIRQSKGRKDRLVYMADDLITLCRKYLQRIEGYYQIQFGFSPGALLKSLFRR